VPVAAGRAGGSKWQKAELLVEFQFVVEQFFVEQFVVEQFVLVVVVNNEFVSKTDLFFEKNFFFLLFPSFFVVFVAGVQAIITRSMRSNSAALDRALLCHTRTTKTKKTKKMIIIKKISFFSCF
jgi:hypothetical protein